MKSTQIIKPNGHQHFDAFLNKLKNQEPFTFVRFSDGETEILKNRELVIGKNFVRFRGTTAKHDYPAYDSKTFDPDKNKQLHMDLMEAARAVFPEYYKGIPTAHNNALDDRNLMIDLNGGSTKNLTFSDLFLNENYKDYLNLVVPVFMDFDSVILVGNFRMKPTLLIPQAKHIPLPDNFFADYENVKLNVLSELERCPRNTLVLSSASSLSNIVGQQIISKRPDLTFIDIGTTLHAKMGLDGNIRSYQLSAMPWKFNNFIPKLKNRINKSYRLKW